MKKFSKEIERLADEQIKEYGYTRADFTEEELQELMEEIQDDIEHPDLCKFDGFWESPRNLFRSERKLLEEAMNQLNNYR